MPCTLDVLTSYRFYFVQILSVFIVADKIKLNSWTQNISADKMNSNPGKMDVVKAGSYLVWMC